MSRQFPVSGLKELDRYLSALPKNLQNGAYRAGLTAAAAVIRDEARILAPKRTGKMAKSIRSGSPRRNEDDTFSISVSLKGEHAFLGFFHEYGVRPHWITASDEALAEVRGRRKGGDKISKKTSMRHLNNMERDGSLVINGKFVGPAVYHPGHAARPFMLPALDVKGDDAVKAFASRIRSYLEGKTGFAAPLDEAA